MKKKLLLIFLLIAFCLLLIACQQNVTYHDASGFVVNTFGGRG